MTTMPLARGSNPCHTRTLTRTVKRTVGRVPTALVYAVGHEGTHELSPKRKQPYSYASARVKFKGSTAIVTIASVGVSLSSRQNKRTKLLFAIFIGTTGKSIFQTGTALAGTIAYYVCCLLSAFYEVDITVHSIR